MMHTIQSDYLTDIYFMQWLLQIIKVRCQKAINPRKLAHIKRRVLEDNIFDIPQNQLTHINIYRELLKAVNNLKYRKVKDYYIIYIPSDICISNTDVPLSTLSRFVCYGDLTTKGYPIISNVIANVIANIAKYYRQYNNIFFGGI